MALKQDERALLQLVTERGQSYEDLAGLLGISEDDVRAKARAALAELGGSDPDADVGLTDYLLGQADPIGRADAVRYLQQDDEARELANEISTKILAIAPGASLPTIPEPKGRKRRAAAPAPSVPSGDETTAVPSGFGRRTPAGRAAAPSSQNRMLVAIAAGGVILLFVILAVAGVFGGDGEDDATGDASAIETPDSSTDTGTETETGLTPEVVAGLSDEQKAELTGLSVEEVAGLSDEEIIAAAEQRTITPVKLDAVGGSGVAGSANFGLASDQLYLDLDLQGLDPKLDEKSSYVVWMMLTEEGGFPVSRIFPDENGQVRERYAVPTPVAFAIGSQASSVQISASPIKELQDSIDVAVQAEEATPIVPYAGETLAAGDIPLAEGESRAGAGAETGAGDGG